MFRTGISKTVLRIIFRYMPMLAEL